MQRRKTSHAHAHTCTCKEKLSNHVDMPAAKVILLGQAKTADRYVHIHTNTYIYIYLCMYFQSFLFKM